MKIRVCLISILCILCILFSGCGAEDTISDGAQAVLDAAINTPNAELHDPDLFTYPGMSSEDKAAVEEGLAAIQANWEAKLGQYFSPGSFDLFMSSYLRTRFFADDPVPSKLVSATLVSRDKTLEVVDIQVDLDGTVSSFTVSLHYNEDGLFYRVEIIEKSE